MEWLEHCIVPAWPAPPNVKSLQTTRIGGVSCAPYDTFNLGDHVGDEPLAVAHNRQLFSTCVPSEPLWLKQVHGTTVVNAAEADCVPTGDASISHRAGAVCAVMTADCLPILLCDTGGTVVGAAHAGWRGLCDGVIEAAVEAMGIAPQALMAWLGPCIGAEAFEVGSEVREAFVARDAEAIQAFKMAAGGKWLADLTLLARQRLRALGVTQIYGGEWCTYRDAARFYSYRRDGVTGRMASLIWLAH